MGARRSVASFVFAAACLASRAEAVPQREVTASWHFRAAALGRQLCGLEPEEGERVPTVDPLKKYRWRSSSEGPEGMTRAEGAAGPTDDDVGLPSYEAWRALELVAERNAARIAEAWCRRKRLTPPAFPPPPRPPPTRGYVFKEETRPGREWSLFGAVPQSPPAPWFPPGGASPAAFAAEQRELNAIRKKLATLRGRRARDMTEGLPERKRKKIAARDAGRDWEREANETMARNAAARSERNAERVYLRSRMDLVDAPGGGSPGESAVGVNRDGDRVDGEGLIGGVVGAAPNAGGRFVADDGTRYMAVKSPPLPPPDAPPPPLAVPPPPEMPPPPPPAPPEEWAEFNKYARAPPPSPPPSAKTLAKLGRKSRGGKRGG